jgi:hypothetical protein
MSIQNSGFRVNGDKIADASVATVRALAKDPEGLSLLEEVHRRFLPLGRNRLDAFTAGLFGGDWREQYTTTLAKMKVLLRRIIEQADAYDIGSGAIDAPCPLCYPSGP